MAHHDALIVGCGSLTRAVCYALAVVGTTASTVTVVSREASNAAEVAYIANTQATLRGSPVRFQARSVSGYTADELARVLDEASPGIVLNCASYQSPWESTRASSAWTDLIRQRGLGFTLPLQSAVAVVLGQVIAARRDETLFLNACLPDLVNPVLKALGVPVFCGVGNVSLLAASLQAAFGLRTQTSLQVLGHHWHLHTPPQPDLEARAWLDGSPVSEVTDHLRPQRAARRSELNVINGQATASLLDALATGREFSTSLPSPGGLPGGYPVRVRDREIEPRLPSTVTLEQAIVLNENWASYDGAQVGRDGKVRLLLPKKPDAEFDAMSDTELDTATTDPETGRIPELFHVTDLPEVCRRMLRLRSQLRLRSSTE